MNKFRIPPPLTRIYKCPKCKKVLRTVDHKTNVNITIEEICNECKKPKPKLDLNKIDKEFAEWRTKNFTNISPDKALLGIMEELGEICHIILKRSQGIRLDETSDDSLKDGVGDLVIYLIDFCNQVEIDIESAIIDTWNKVKKRDWNKHRQHYKLKKENK